MRILHVTSADVWADALASDSEEISSPSLATSGFIHACSEEQLPAVLARFHGGRRDLVVLVIETDLIDADLRWERPVHPDGTPTSEAEGSERFPHVYGPIPRAAIVAVRDLA